MNSGETVVLGQNGSGQNGIRTKWYGQNGMDKMLQINHQSIPLLLQYDFFINPASNLTPLAFLYVLIAYL